MVSQLSDMLSKEGFYPILKTLLINAEPYEKSDAYRLKVQKSTLPESTVRNLHNGGRGYLMCFQKGPPPENADGECGAIRKFRILAPGSANSELPGSRARNFDESAAVSRRPSKRMSVVF